jgi:hypothetical protein
MTCSSRLYENLIKWAITTDKWSFFTLIKAGAIAIHSSTS